MLRRKAQLQR